MTREYVEWQGPGWYAPVRTGTGEDAAIGWFKVGVGVTVNTTTSTVLGNPVYANTPDDLWA